MFNNELLECFNELKKNNKSYFIGKLYCIDCVEHSWKYFFPNKKLTDELKLEIASCLYDEYLDTDIQISKLSDIIVENWNKYKNDDDFCLYDYIEEWGIN